MNCCSSINVPMYGVVDEETSMAATDADDGGLNLTLDQLPPELLIRICDFLDARVIHKLQRVCRVFEELLSGDTYFKTRVSRRWPKKYPAVPVDNLDWQEACAEREETHAAWTNQEAHLEHFTYNDYMFAAVDTVHLMKDGQILAAGSRDRYLTILDLAKYDSTKEDSKKDMEIFSDNKVHKGWIWSMDSQDNILATGSWDTFIRLWDLQAGVAPADVFKCKTAVLDLHLEHDLIIAAGYDKNLHLIDRRSGTITKKTYHRKPVLCVAVDDQFIITGSEDKTICIYDRRADKNYKRLELDTYPLDMSYGNNQLWYGDKQGFLHLMDTANGAFDLVEKYDVGHKGKLTGVVHTLGAVYTSSTDHTIKVLEPSRNPGVIATLTSHLDGVTGISYQNGVLASAGCDISVGIWRPRQH
ncbi:F-box/WD repeat-containing protein 9-like [Haliotis rufescens]|uniref:F-box/WD repeat-containing protein 9-like n=1 Tax=Haliotis rufescens TaxID=6454 RepID=UPI001EAFE442|nr:F-box/WD repeat-containing protein 9-like [Haliotis rufescens]